MNCSAQDVLGSLPVENVWRWYHRLATAIGARKVGGAEPMASRFLQLYVSPRSRFEPESFTAPGYLREHSVLQSALAHHRAVYLSQEQMRTGAGGRAWAGIRPRWQDPGRFGWTKGAPMSMHYTALVEIPIRWQVTGNDAERDILYALGLGFQLRTDVVCSVTPKTDELSVVFDSFEARVEDRYDFNFDEHFTVPNPDHKSAIAGAVCPGKETIVVSHRNAQRMERSRLAASYDLRSEGWTLSGSDLAGPGAVSL